MGLRHARFFKATILGLLTGALGVASALCHWHGLEENVGLGLLFKLRNEASSSRAIVSIDDVSATAWASLTTLRSRAYTMRALPKFWRRRAW
jgi:hypothetical protein